jgi:branched-chain amino acid transport system ATP-binding protein
VAHEHALLSVDGVNVNFGGLKALSDVHCRVNPGEVVGLIGPNGAGKTTLFNVLSGIVKPDSGVLTLNGVERDWLAPDELVSHRISRTLQGVGLFGDLTVLENVMIGAEVDAKAGLLRSILGASKKSEDELRQRAHIALENSYCADIANRRADSLPYPITKRVAIARALVSNPQLLLLDEPAGGLGPQDIDWMKSLIRNIRSRTSVLIVEHHMDVVMNVCDRIYVLNFGQLIAEGTPAQVRENPAVIAAYLGNQGASA